RDQMRQEFYQNKKQEIVSLVSLTKSGTFSKNSNLDLAKINTRTISELVPNRNIGILNTPTEKFNSIQRVNNVGFWGEDNTSFKMKNRGIEFGELKKSKQNDSRSNIKSTTYKERLDS